MCIIADVACLVSVAGSGFLSDVDIWNVCDMVSGNVRGVNGGVGFENALYVYRVGSRM